MNSSFFRVLSDLIANIVGDKDVARTVVLLLSMCTMLCISYMIYHILYRYLVPFHHKQIKSKSNSDWIQALLRYRIIEKAYLFAPVFFIYIAIHFVEGEKSIFNDRVTTVVEKAVLASIITITTILICSWLNVLNQIYKNLLQISQGMSIRGYVELAKIVSWGIAIILIISIILNIELVKILTGLGVLSAALLLIFKDTLLGFVSNIQFSAYDIIRIGDWIEMSEYNLNGTVLDITLSTVQVQNFDKSIVTVPTSDLLVKGVTNWRGMLEANGRRIKKVITIDIETIKFCDSALLDRIYRADALHPHIRCVSVQGVQHSVPNDSAVDCVTNTTLYRQYAIAYLNSITDIYKEHFPFAVHYLQPTELGLPIELYMFTNRLNFAEYEALQTEVLDHLISIMPLFELRFFQKIT